MAELTLRERLQPSLLDRLTDNDPRKTQETFEQRVLSLARLRESVLRDLTWLLNAHSYESVSDLTSYPQVARSVLNYGIPDLTGRTAAGVDIRAVERLLLEAIWSFEPRILRNTVKVKLVVDEARMNHNAMVFDIEGELWAQPVPLQIYFRTELDLEAGAARVIDAERRGGR